MKVYHPFQCQTRIKALKTLVWHVSRAGVNNLKKIYIYDEQARKKKNKGQTSSSANLFWDEHGQITKVVCIIASLVCFSV